MPGAFKLTSTADRFRETMIELEVDADRVEELYAVAAREPEYEGGLMPDAAEVRRRCNLMIDRARAGGFKQGDLV